MERTRLAGNTGKTQANLFLLGINGGSSDDEILE